MSEVVLRSFRDRGSWLRARRLGSSDAPAVVGVSPYRSGWDVLERILGDQVVEHDSAAMARGRQLEPTVLRAYAHLTGLEVRPCPANSLYQREDWATATPDAFAPGLVVEAKTDRDRANWGPGGAVIDRWSPDWEAVIRPDYYIQVAHQLWVLDAPAGDLAVLVPGEDPFLPELRVYRILRDPVVEEALVDRLREWWKRHVVERVPLAWDGSAAASRIQARRKRPAAERWATPDEVSLAAAYLVARADSDAAKVRKDELGQRLIDAAGDSSVLRVAGGGRITVVANGGRLVLDEKALLAEVPALGPLLDQYRTRTNPYVYPRITGLGGR